MDPQKRHSADGHVAPPRRFRLVPAAWGPSRLTASGGLAALLLVLVFTACAAPAAHGKVYVGEPVDGCGGGGCRGPSLLKYKPRNLTIWLDRGGRFTVTKLRWKRWGSSRATATGRTRLDNDTGRVRVVLTRITPAGCSDSAGKYRAYSRVTVYAKNLGYSEISASTLGC